MATTANNWKTPGALNLGRYTKGATVDLLQMAKRIGPQCEAAEHEDLSGEKSLTQDSVVEGWRSHLALQQRHRGTLNESTNVGVKTDGSRIGGPELCL